MKRISLAIVSSLLWVAYANAGLNTATYIQTDPPVPSDAGGSVTGDMSGVGAVTIMDIEDGDMWNGGDNFQFLHDSQQVTESFTATVRVVSQTAAVDGRWGKAGLQARSDLNPNASNAQAGIALGNGSSLGGNVGGGDNNPVPVRIHGRTQNDGQGGFETNIVGAAGSTLALDGDGNVANDWSDKTDIGVWLSLEYKAATNEFLAGVAPDVAGVPGVWSYSPAVTDVPADGDGFYVGLAYSAHGDLQIRPTEVSEQPNSMHGLTFDNYSIVTVPEPSTFALLGLAICGVLGLRRRS